MTAEARVARRAPIEPWICLAIASSTLTLALFSVDRGLGRSPNPLAVGGWWWLRFVVLDLGVALATWLLALGAQRARPFWPIEKSIRAVVAVSLATIALFLNANLLRSLTSSPLSRTSFLLLATILLSLSVVALVPADSKRARLLRVGALAATALAALGALRPPVRGAQQDDVDAAARIAGAESSERLLVLGLDGADWRILDQLFARGLAPNLARFREQAAWGDLATIKPTQSPVIWTTIATGRKPADHGVPGHTVERPVGLDIGLPATRLRVRGLGVTELRRWLRRSGQLVQGPVTGAERRAAAFWNITTYFKRPISVVSWWATWPAESILGRMSSDRVFYDRARAQGADDDPDDRLAFPPELASRLRRLALRPDQVDYEMAREFLDVPPDEYRHFASLPYDHHEIRSEFRLYYAMFQSDLRFSSEVMRLDESAGRAPTDELFLTRFLDHTSHCCLKYSSLVDDNLDTTAEDRKRFGMVTERAYAGMDRAVGEIVERFGRANVIVVSDHGFRRETDPSGKPRYHHETAPPGIFLAWGPSIRPGRVKGLTVYDVLPLLLALKGLPVARDLEGKVPRRILNTPGQSRVVPTYDFLIRSNTKSRASRSDQEILEELRALGYLK